MTTMGEGVAVTPPSQDETGGIEMASNEDTLSKLGD